MILHPPLQLADNLFAQQPIEERLGIQRRRHLLRRSTVVLVLGAIRGRNARILRTLSRLFNFYNFFIYC